MDITSYDCAHIHTHGQPQEVEEGNLEFSSPWDYCTNILCCVHIQISHTHVYIHVHTYLC